MSVYRIKTINERPSVNVKVERGSTLTFTRDIYARKNYATVKNALNLYLCSTFAFSFDYGLPQATTFSCTKDGSWNICLLNIVPHCSFGRCWYRKLSTRGIFSLSYPFSCACHARYSATSTNFYNEWFILYPCSNSKVPVYEKKLDITKPRYSEQIVLVIWPFVISRFHCTIFKISCATGSPKTREIRFLEVDFFSCHEGFWLHLCKRLNFTA